jgi:hypothetical protein
VNSTVKLRHLPHFKQDLLAREVINPQNGHILCDRKRRGRNSFVNESVMKAIRPRKPADTPNKQESLAFCVNES